MAAEVTQKNLVEIRDLDVIYQTRVGPVSAIDDVSMDIFQGEILGLVGESGCGKSTFGKALMRLLPASCLTHGKILFDGEDVLTYDQESLRDFRGRRISMIFQDPMTSLNPVQRIEDHLIETLYVHEPETQKIPALERIKTLIERLGIQTERIEDYPHQLSGGMRQRVMIGLGLLLNPHLIIADEATTSLDVIVEAKLLDQLREIRDEFGVSMLVITHNIALIAELADRIAVMYAGRIAEIGSVYKVFDNPLHPYTQGLLQSVPNIKLDEREVLYKMPGEPPMSICSDLSPTLLHVEENQQVNCWLYQDHPEKNVPTLEVSS